MNYNNIQFINYYLALINNSWTVIFLIRKFLMMLVILAAFLARIGELFDQHLKS